MSLKVVSFFDFKSASWSDDWSDQELAEFYRVEASLIRANIPIETDRGRSDEGDPWFVFCNANTGEIIVHFARFDGTYLVASPALDGCTRGRDFRALIEAQLASHPLVIPKAASGGKLFIHPAALLIVLVATCFFKLSQTTAAAGELHQAQPAHPGVGSLSHSDSELQAVMLDERAAAAVLAAIVTGIAWAQSHDFNLWSIGAAVPTKIDVPSQVFSVSTSSSGAAGQFDAVRLLHARGAAAEPEGPLANIGGDSSVTSPGYRSLNGPNDHSAASRTFFSFDTSAPAASQTLPATSGLLSPGSAPPSPQRSALQTEITPISSTVSSDTTASAASSETTEAAQKISVGTPTTNVQNALLAGATSTGSQFNASGTSLIYALTTGNDTNASLHHSSPFAASDLITGIVNSTALSPALSTFSSGDNLALTGATINITDIANYSQNELAGVTLTGTFQFVVTELAPTGGLFNFNIDFGVTNVESLNSTNDAAFLNLGGGTNVEVGGAASATSTNVYSSYSAPTGPVSFQFDGGVDGVTIENDASASAPTTETIRSTGAANGSTAHPDFVQATDNSGTISSLTINATTSLVMGLANADLTSTATLTVSGTAALLDLTPGGDDTFSTVSASGLTNGALHIEASSALTAFTGGGGGGNEVLYDGTGISASATAINGGGGTGNVLSAQLANASNGGIFTNWQTLDITDYGGTPFDASLLTHDAISGVQYSGGDATAETVLNIAPASTVTVTGAGTEPQFDASLTITHHSGATSDSLAVTFNNTDTTTALNILELGNLTSTGDATVSIASTGVAGSAAGAGCNGVGTLTETDGHLTAVKVTGGDYFCLGYNGGVSTDPATTSTANITSALATINASAATGGVAIYAGNTTLDASGFEVSYRGLTLDGGSGNGDILYNGANSGVTMDGNGKGDAVWLGGSDASGTLGTGASDLAFVGDNVYGTAVTPAGREAVGAALGDTVTFKAGATATITVGQGAEWDGNTYAGGQGRDGVGQTIVDGAVAGMNIGLTGIVGDIATIQNQQAAVARAGTLTTAENDAVAAMGVVGVAYFTFGGNEYLVAAHTPEWAVSAGDAVVELHAVTFTGLSMSAGVVHLA